MDKRKIILDEKDIPNNWYNILADMPNKPLPTLHPETKEPIEAEHLEGLFANELVKQEISTDKWIEIPDEVRDIYKLWRPSPLFRACGLEKALDTPAKIYYKYEGVSPSGSHKANTAIPQAYYNKQQGIKKIATETGAGQWGSALSFACKHFGIDCEVYMVKASYHHKPYRKMVMQTYGAKVIPSPSEFTNAGREILAKDPDTTGSLGMAISEAIEAALGSDSTKYALGSVLNHVNLHQTIIGQEAIKQMEVVGDMPDIIIAPFGGGSNFAGLTFPFLRLNFENGSNIRCIASEPTSCPKLTRGVFRYDFGDNIGMTPLLPMYTLGHNFVPAPIHAGGLRYHGAGVIVSQLLKDKLIEASSHNNIEVFDASVAFARAEGIIPAPEAGHGIATAIKEAKKCKESGESKTILFNLSGHGNFDMQSYGDYISGNIEDHNLSKADIETSLKKLDTPIID